MNIPKTVTMSLILFLTPFLLFGFINPNFTPLDLLKQSELVLHLKFTGVDKDGYAQAEVIKVIKGEYAEKTFKIDLYAPGELFKKVSELVKSYFTSGPVEGFFFSGSFGNIQQKEEEDDMMDEPGEEDVKKAFIQFQGNKWMVIKQYEEGIWDFDKIDPYLLGTWAGGTDMLGRCIQYILSNPDASVPIKSERYWDKPFTLGTFTGPVTSMQPVDLNSDGRNELLITGEKGDSVYRWDGKSVKNITSDLKLTSASIKALSADFTGDGKTDIASAAKDKIRIFAQGKDGTFSEYTSLEVRNCTALSAVDSGSGRPALVAGIGYQVVLLTIKDDRTFGKKDLTPVTDPGEMMPAAASIECADFTGDGLPDILQICEAYGFMYKGTGPGTFDKPVKIPVCTGTGKTASCIADLDADGLMDVCTSSSENAYPFIWHNYGASGFAEKVRTSGEIEYIPKTGRNSLASGDVNSDGRTDILMTYGVMDPPPQIFFNRGFRSFGHARLLEVTYKELGAVQQAGTLCDINNDGTLDMCLALDGGKLIVYPRKQGEEPDLALIVSVSPSSKHAGPVTVKAVQFDRQLGAHSVTAGGPGALFGMREPGPIEVTWQFPGEKAKTKEFVIEDEPLYIFIDKE